MSDSEDPLDQADDEVDDLFGDGGDDDDGLGSDNGRVLSDADLASDKDGAEQDRDDDMDMDENVETRPKLIMNIQMYRHRTPKPTDGKLRSLKPPSFLKWAAEEYKPDTFQPTEWDLENVKSDNPRTVVRYQRDPATGKLKSNALVYRWSDGSMTMSVGGDHYEVQKKMMAPPSDKPYLEVQDSHCYAAAAHLSSNLLLTVGHISEQYTVLPNRNMQDDALAALASKMQAAARGKAKSADHIFTATRDPELQRKEAEMAEKERMKAQRRRENAAARLDSRTGNFRSGGGLSIGDLEGGRRGAGGARKRGQPGASRPKKRRPEYDSDDDLPAGRGRNDDYDHEDDFIAPSDDEGSVAEDDEDEEDLLDDDDEEDEAPRAKRQKTADAEDEDADADADLEDIDAPAPSAEQSRGRRRNIVDDDDDE